MVSVIVSTGRTDKWVISGLLSVWIRTAERRCRLCIHIPHYPHRNPNLNSIPNSKANLTLNLTLIWSCLINKHQYAQPNMSANWMTSRLCDQSAAQSAGSDWLYWQCAELSVRARLTITFMINENAKLNTVSKQLLKTKVLYNGRENCQTNQ